MQQWEYEGGDFSLDPKTSEEFFKILNIMGERGWEVISAFVLPTYPPTLQILFKRPKADAQR